MKYPGPGRRNGEEGREVGIVLVGITRRVSVYMYYKRGAQV